MLARVACTAARIGFQSSHRSFMRAQAVMQLKQ
jgi:hypothetical protein